MREGDRARLPVKLAHTLLEVLRGHDEAVEVPGHLGGVAAHVLLPLAHEVPEHLVGVGVADLAVGGRRPVVADVLQPGVNILQSNGIIFEFLE